MIPSISIPEIYGDRTLIFPDVINILQRSGISINHSYEQTGGFSWCQKGDTGVVFFREKEGFRIEFSSNHTEQNPTLEALLKIMSQYNIASSNQTSQTVSFPLLYNHPDLERILLSIGYILGSSEYSAALQTNIETTCDGTDRIIGALNFSIPLGFSESADDPLISLISQIPIIREKNIQAKRTPESSKDVIFHYRDCTFAIFPSSHNSTIETVEIHMEINSDNRGKISSSFFREVSNLLKQLNITNNTGVCWGSLHEVRQEQLDSTLRVAFARIDEFRDTPKFLEKYPPATIPGQK